MFISFAGRFLSLFMSVVLFFNTLSFGVAGDSVKIDYDFSNDTRGSAAGTVTLDAKKDGEYELYWGDEDGTRLTYAVDKYNVPFSEFASVDVDDGTGSVDIQPFTAIPDGAETVLVYKNKTLKAKEDLPDEKITDNGEMLYSFGALSDVHFNRYYKTLNDDALTTFPNALLFLDKCGVDLVAMSGDLSSGGEKDAFQKFHKCASDVKYPVLTCTGNHDVNNGGLDVESWHENINTGVYGETKMEGVASIGNNQVDFVYAPQKLNGDVFIFLSQTNWDYNHDTSRLLTDEQLDWLGEQLETYKNSTVYLFFHTFVQNCFEGEDFNMGEGNLINSKGVHYDLVYTAGTPDEIRFRDYLKEYKNVVFFNGHSHWSYEMQKYNPNLNIADYNGEYATMVHVSSVSSPRIIKSDKSEKRTEMNMKRSEGMLVSVYENRIVINAVDFLRGKMLAYATYNIELNK